MIKTLIVGENGFIAKRLSKYIDSMGCKSINYQLTTSSSEIKNDTIFLDLSDAENFDYSLLENFSYVILLGGVSSLIFVKIIQFNLKINFEGTKFFINKCLMRGIKVLFFQQILFTVKPI